MKEQRAISKGLQNRYVVTWHCDVIKPSKRSRKTLSLAICAFSNGVCNIAVIDKKRYSNNDLLKILTIHNVYVSDASCEDAPYCFNLSCPRNKAVLSKFKRYGIKTRKHLENVHKFLEDVRKKSNLTNAENGQVVYYDKPIGYYKPNKREKHEDLQQSNT
jgi:hypothetical protein